MPFGVSAKLVDEVASLEREVRAADDEWRRARGGA